MTRPSKCCAPANGMEASLPKESIRRRREWITPDALLQPRPGMLPMPSASPRVRTTVRGRSGIAKRRSAQPRRRLATRILGRGRVVAFSRHASASRTVEPAQSYAEERKAFSLERSEALVGKSSGFNKPQQRRAQNSLIVQGLWRGTLSVPMQIKRFIEAY